MSSLHIYELTVQSSFSENTEVPAVEESFDTIQWWIGEDISWRIRTFDIDSDIHIHRIDSVLSVEQIDELMNKRFSDILVGRYSFRDISFEDNDVVLDKMKTGSLKVDKNSLFAFWNHDNRKYQSKSRPEGA